jgi:glyoxylase I family protein
MLKAVHHIAVICSNIEVSRKFYTEVLGLEIIREVYRSERDSWKMDLSLNGTYIIELFSFPNPPTRVSKPEALGLRHIAFSVANLDSAISELNSKSVPVEPVRTDEHTGKRFTFVADPDLLPIELYEL